LLDADLKYWLKETMPFVSKVAHVMASKVTVLHGEFNSEFYRALCRIKLHDFWMGKHVCPRLLLAEFTNFSPYLTKPEV